MSGTDKKLSFSAKVKQEAAGQIFSNRKAALAELAALIACIGQFGMEKDGKIRLFLKSDNLQALTKCFTLIQKTANISCKFDFAEAGQGSTDLTGILPQKELEFLFRLLDAEGTDGRVRSMDGCVPERLLATDMCSRAFIRNAFLCTGSVSNPEKEYHMEFHCLSDAQAQQIRSELRKCGVQAGQARRRNHPIVYIRDSGQIVDVLNLMGALGSSMQMENAIILRQMRGSVNRKVNCETANIRKSVDAANRQIEDILLILENECFSQLPEHLQQAARLRIEHQELSLKELGELLDPPVGKSGVNHRLRKLSALAQQIREDGKGQ